MADGSLYPEFGSMKQDSMVTISLDEAIAELEAGAQDASFSVNLGDGQIARADGLYGAEGLLQRLRGYRLVQALAELESQPKALNAEDASLKIHPNVSVILDALKK